MLSISQLHRQIEKREEKKVKTYQKILDKCHYRIINTNEKSSDCHCFFVVPTVVFGIPLYNVTNCVVYIMKDLTARGFRVYYTSPNLLFINWINKPTREENIYTNNDYKLLNDKPYNNSVYHPTDFKSLEYKGNYLLDSI